MHSYILILVINFLIDMLLGQDQNLLRNVLILKTFRFQMNDKIQVLLSFTTKKNL